MKKIQLIPAKDSKETDYEAFLIKGFEDIMKKIGVEVLKYDEDEYTLDLFPFITEVTEKKDLEHEIECYRDTYKLVYHLESLKLEYEEVCEDHGADHYLSFVLEEKEFEIIKK